MGHLVFMGGLLLASIAAVDHYVFELGLPLGFVWSPWFWLAYLVIMLVAMGVRLVKQQEEWVIERFGSYHRTLRAGLNLIIPIVDQLRAEFDLRERVVDVPEQEAITKDNAAVTIDGVLYYKIVNGHDAAYGAANLEAAITNLSQTTMRSAVGSMDLDQIFEQREAINARVVKVLSEAAVTWGAMVLRYEIKNIKLPKALMEAMERQMKAEREKRAVVLESEGQKTAAINRAQGEQQANVLVAEGDRDAAIARATGQAKAIELVREQILAEGGPQAVQLEVAKEALAQYGHLARETNSMILSGESADPAGWMAKAMAMWEVVSSGALTGSSSKE